MQCTLWKNLEVLDEKLAQLEKNIKNCQIEARAAKEEMREIKRLVNELKKK